MSKLFQASTMMSLLKGNFDYTISIEYFLKNGNTGIGSYNGLNGEAIFLDGVAYNATGAGNVKVMDIPQTGVTFGQITKFSEDENIKPLEVPDFSSFKDLSEKLNKIALIKGPNYFYMIKGTATFSKITCRTAYKQRKPFRPMEIVAKELKYYTYENIKGTIIAVYSPSYAKGLSFDGWHIHFLSEDKTKGGHVTELAGAGLNFKVNIMDKYEIKLPSSKEFISADYSSPVDTSIENTVPSEAAVEVVKEEKK